MDSRRKKELKARAHAIKPVVLTGHAGLSEAVLAEIDRALDAHELIKVRLVAVDRDDCAAQAQSICGTTSAELVQIVGRVVTLFRKRRDPS